VKAGTPNAPEVSVIIITRNTCALTRAAIRSAEEAAGGGEIIVVDNGSSDDTATVLPPEFPSVQLIRSEINLGFARACNLAARRAHGEFLLLLNSDARLEPGALGRAVQFMRATPDCAVAGAQLLSLDGTRQNSIANFPTLSTELLNKSLLRQLFPKRFPGKERPLAEATEVESVVGAFFLIRKAAWDALGGFDERFFFFFEETDFCLQARRRGWKVFHLPQVRVWHEQGGTAKQSTAAARIEYWRSRYAYFAKNEGWGTRTLLAVVLPARLLVEWLASGIMAAMPWGLSGRWSDRWRVQGSLLAWHLRGRPADEGLPRAATARPKGT